MGWLGRGLGQFGSDVGTGWDINQQWKARTQQMAMEQARQKIAMMQAPLQLQELQQRIKAMQNPQPAGVEKLPAGGLGGVTFQNGVYSIQNLAPGAPPEPKFASLQQAAAYYLQKGDFEKLKAVNDEIEKARAQKAPPSPKDAFELWQSQNPKASVADWLKLQEKFKKPGGEGGEKTPFELWKAQNPKGAYQDWINASANKPAKPIPPDIQNLLTSPVPPTPTAEQSRRLADAADRIFGGTSYKQDLMGRGRRSSFPFVGTLGRAPYVSVAYSPDEYAATLNLVRQGAARGANSDLSDLGGTPAQ